MAACNIKTKERIGEIGINNNGTKMQIIEYFGKDNMTVQFLDKHKYIIKNVSYGNFKKGKVINLYDKTFCGIGYLGEYLDNGIKLKDRIDYKYWTSMIDRCYGTNNIERHNNYLDCFVCEEWLCFANFEKWFKDNYYRIPNKKMQLDKDLISLCTNKIYCPEYCRFVPTDINHLFSTLFSSQNKKYLHGVYKKNGLYRARVTINGKHHDICGFKTMEEAHKAYIKLKDETIHSYAILYKDYLPIDLYETLINWSMEKVFKLIEN